MKIYTLLKRGTLHPEFCEDFLFNTEINERFVICSVFDGCSGGDNSQFASALWGKILRTVCSQGELFNTIANTDMLAKEILYNTILKVIEIKRVGEFISNDLLATVMLLVYDKTMNVATIIACGDGVVAINGAVIEIDQENKPDYPAYFLNQIANKDDFLGWLIAKNHVFSVNNVKDISIATDGILSYTLTQGQEVITEYSAFDFLCNNLFLENNKVMLARKHNLLRTKSALINTDDIAMIRIKC